jgi:hypothetical protein
LAAPLAALHLKSGAGRRFSTSNMHQLLAWKEAPAGPVEHDARVSV